MKRVNHILIVDDEEDIVSSLRILFEMEGWRVTSTTSSMEAVRWVGSGLQPDIVLMDYRMPVMTGGDALRQMRNAGMKSPALLMSARQELQEAAVSFGFDECLGKPFSFVELMSLVRQMLGKGVAPD